MSTAQKKAAGPKLIGPKSMKPSLLALVGISDLQTIANKKAARPSQQTMTLNNQKDIPIKCLQQAVAGSLASDLYYGWNCAYTDGSTKAFIPAGEEHAAAVTYAQRDPNATKNWPRFGSLVLEAQQSLYFAKPEALWELAEDFHTIAGAAGMTGPTVGARTNALGAAGTTDGAHTFVTMEDFLKASGSLLGGITGNQKNFDEHVADAAKTQAQNNQKFKQSDQQHAESARMHEQSAARHDDSDAKHLASNAKHLESAKKQKKTDADIEQLRQESALKEAESNKKIAELTGKVESLKSCLFGGDDTSSVSTKSLFSTAGSGALPPPLSAGGSGGLPTKMSSIRTRSVPKTASPIPEHAAVAPHPFARKKWQPEEDDSEDEDSKYLDSMMAEDMDGSTNIPAMIAIKTGAPGSLPPTPESPRKPAAVDNLSSSRAGTFGGLSFSRFGSFFGRASGATKDDDEDHHNNESGTAARPPTHKSLGTPECKRSPPHLRSSLKKKGGSRNSNGSVAFKQQVEVQPFSLAIASNPENSNGLSTALDQPVGSPYSQNLRDPLYTSYQMPAPRGEFDTYLSLRRHSGLSHQQIEDGKKELEAQDLEEQEQLDEASDDSYSTDSQDENTNIETMAYNGDAPAPAAVYGDTLAGVAAETSEDVQAENAQSPLKRRRRIPRTSVGPQESAPSKGSSPLPKRARKTDKEPMNE